MTLEEKINYYANLSARAKQLEAEKDALSKELIATIKGLGLTQKETELYLAKVYPTTREYVDVAKARELLPAPLLSQMMKSTTYDCLRTTRKDIVPTFPQ